MLKILVLKSSLLELEEGIVSDDIYELYELLIHQFKYTNYMNYQYRHPIYKLISLKFIIQLKFIFNNIITLERFI